MMEKHERWAKAQPPKTVHCVRLGDHFIGKMFELLTVDYVDLFPLDEASDFTVEAWIDKHVPQHSIMLWEGYNKSWTLDKGEYFMVLDAISLTEKPLTEAELERLDESGYFTFSADWYWSVLHGGKVWMFTAKGRLSVVSKKVGGND